MHFSVRSAAAALAVSLAVLVAPAHGATKPTVVLVHGAFADASGFAAVTGRLQDRGYTVVAPANPLRGLSSDAAYVASVLKTIKGPVVLVAHSYGGAVVTQAARAATNVKALVYIDAFALDEGESALDIAKRFPGSQVLKALRPQSDGTELAIDPAAFPTVFAADVPRRSARRMATAQRPVAAAALEEKSTLPAWKTIPSWYLVGRQDRVVPPAAQRFMARRARSRIVEVDASHASYISRPSAVASLILRAAGARR